MKRIYELIMEEHLEKDRQMLFLVGPRQVGKTTTSLEVSTPRSRYLHLNWDIEKDRTLIRKGADVVAEAAGINHMTTKPVVIFDELHKLRKWKTFLKGFFDKYSKLIQIIVTGSARLDIFELLSPKGERFLLQGSPYSGQLHRL